MANYPRELFECEKQAKEQIPLLFGLDLTKHNSGTSVGSDQAEAAPTSSNRTETTHSTAISDESNVRFLFTCFHLLTLIFIELPPSDLTVQSE